VDSIVKKIVAGIVEDISDRRGIGNEFEQIDADIKAELITEWEEIVRNNFREMTEDLTESEIAQEILQEVFKDGWERKD